MTHYRYSYKHAIFITWDAMIQIFSNIEYSSIYIHFHSILYPIQCNGLLIISLIAINDMLFIGIDISKHHIPTYPYMKYTIFTINTNYSRELLRVTLSYIDQFLSLLLSDPSKTCKHIQRLAIRVDDQLFLPS